MARTWLKLTVGVWLLFSPWLLGFADNFYAKWSQAVCGLILIVLALYELIVEVKKK